MCNVGGVTHSDELRCESFSPALQFPSASVSACSALLFSQLPVCNLKVQCVRIDPGNCSVLLTAATISMVINLLSGLD